MSGDLGEAVEGGKAAGEAGRGWRAADKEGELEWRRARGGTAADAEAEAEGVDGMLTSEKSPNVLLSCRTRRTGVSCLAAREGFCGQTDR